MYIVSSKKPRKTNRTKTARYRAALKKKNEARRKRLHTWKTPKKRTVKKRAKKK
jgi:hypothetical protein